MAPFRKIQKLQLPNILISILGWKRCAPTDKAYATGVTEIKQGASYTLNYFININKTINLVIVHAKPIATAYFSPIFVHDNRAILKSLKYNATSYIEQEVFPAAIKEYAPCYSVTTDRKVNMLLKRFGSFD